MKKLKKFLLAKSFGFYINVLSFVNPKRAVELAYKIYSEPRAGRLKIDQLPEILQSAKKHFYHFEGERLYVYMWQGNRNVILLVHGWESNASRWAEFIPYLHKSGCSIVAVDAPAHGLSSGKEFSLFKYAQFLKIVVRHHKPTSIIGHSLGGAALVYFQSKFKNPFTEKIVLLGAPSDMRILIQNYINLLSLNTKMAKLLEVYFYNRFKITLDDFSGKIFGENMKVNGIIAHDVFDDVVFFAEAKKIAAGWKGATFIETKDLGHSMHNDQLYNQVYDYLFEVQDL